MNRREQCSALLVAACLGAATVHAYTLGNAIETVDWETVTETVEHEGRRYRVYLVAVVYTSG
jgi:hypothetical protein